MNWQNKKVIITGGAGVIGQALIKSLVEKGAVVRCFDIQPKPKDFPSLAEYSQRDLAKLNPIEFTSFDPEVIFHLAATFERTEEDPDFWQFNFTNNVVLSHKVIDAAKFCKNLKKFIFASSYLIYDPATYLFEEPREVVNLSETGKIDTRNICGAAKYYTEKELEFMDNFEKCSFSKLSARIFRVYGRNSRDFVSRCVRSALNNQEIKLYSKENSFDYIFANDVAKGLIKLAESSAKKEIVNLGTGKARKIQEMISILKTHFSDLKVTDEASLPAGRQELFEESSADMKKFQEITGWVPETTLEQGIKELIDHEKNKQN